MTSRTPERIKETRTPSLMEMKRLQFGYRGRLLRKVHTMSKVSRKLWVWMPARHSGVPDALKQEISAKGDALVQNHLKPGFVQPPPKDLRYNYIVNLYTKWRGRYFYFMSKWASPGPNRIAPFFEVGFARLEYAGMGRFHLAYFRHTGKWSQISSGLTLDNALELIKKEGIFQP